MLRLDPDELRGLEKPSRRNWARKNDASREARAIAWATGAVSFLTQRLVALRGGRLGLQPRGANEARRGE